MCRIVVCLQLAAAAAFWELAQLSRCHPSCSSTTPPTLLHPSRLCPCSSDSSIESRAARAESRQNCKSQMQTWQAKGQELKTKHSKKKGSGKLVGYARLQATLCRRNNTNYILPIFECFFICLQGICFILLNQ